MLFVLLSLGGAIASLHIARVVQDESLTIISLMLGTFAFITSLVLTPWQLKIAIVVIILLLPSCSWLDLRPSIACPRLCLKRDQCEKPHVR